MKNYISLLLITILLVLLYFEFQPAQHLSESSITPDAVSNESGNPADFVAAFAIYTHGVQRNFSDPKYHNLSPDLYIQADNPHIVHIKKTAIIWDDFFKTLPMKVTAECLTTGLGEIYCNGQGGELKFYINGKRVANALTSEIKDGDQLLISFGYESEEQITIQKEQVQKPSRL